MKIAIDIDEVLSDTLTALISFHNEKYGTSLKKSDFHSYKYWEVWGGTMEEAITKVYEFYESDYFKNINPVQNSQIAVKSLKKHHDLVVVSSRQHEIEEKTLEWLEKHFPKAFSDVHFTNAYSLSGQSQKKSIVCHYLNAKTLIDDCLDYAIECSRSMEMVFLFDSPWNRLDLLPYKVRRVRSWNEIVERLK